VSDECYRTRAHSGSDEWVSNGGTAATTAKRSLAAAAAAAVAAACYQRTDIDSEFTGGSALRNDRLA